MGGRRRRRSAHLTAGLADADSWTTDAHKWLNVPYDSGIAIVRDAAAHHAAMTPRRGLLRRDGRAASAIPYNWVAESSRRARGFPIYAALRELGRDGLADMIERCCALARRMADGLRDAPGVTILNDVVLNQVLVRFAPPSDGGGRDDAGDRRLHPRGDRRGPGRRDVLARRHDVARDGRDADLGLELVDDRGGRRPVGGRDPALRRRRSRLRAARARAV